jgi:predicted transcriptional regulator
MSQAEKDAFSVGFSSELIDAINASRDRVNVIESIFGSQSARDRIRIALGPQKARELEAYVKLEQTLDMLRTATQGNSTTAKQLIQAGLMGGGAGGLGYLASGGDFTTGMSAATVAVLGRRGLQMLGKQVDDQVMKTVAEVLASPDPAKLQRAIQNASLSKAHMEAIDGIMRGIAAASRGAVVPATGMALATPGT